MLNWLHASKSAALSNARERARERARQATQEAQILNSGFGAPSQDGMVVEELSPEEFLRLFPQAAKHG